MNVLDKQMAGKAAMVMTAPFVAGTGLGVTIANPSEFDDQVSVDPSEFEFWDTLDSPNANPWDRLQRIQRTNAQIRQLSASDIYFVGGTGSGELPQYSVTEARSNRFSAAVRGGRQLIHSGIDRVPECIRDDCQPTTLVIDVAAAVAEIRSTLSLSITELSAMLDVKRPTIYSWLRGDSLPQSRNLERIAVLHQISRRWDELSGRPLRRHLRHAFSENGTTLFGLLKRDDLAFDEIEKHLLALAKLPASQKLPSMKELAAGHGLSTEAYPDADLIRDIESGRRLTND